VYNNLLTADERIILLNILTSEATDEILLDAVTQTTESRKRCSSDMKDVKLRAPKPAAPKPSKDTATITPPGVIQSRLDKKVVENIIRHLTKDGPDTAANITRGINGRAGQTSNYLCTLVNRGTLKYNGALYST